MSSASLTNLPPHPFSSSPPLQRAPPPPTSLVAAAAAAAAHHHHHQQQQHHHHHHHHAQHHAGSSTHPTHTGQRPHVRSPPAAIASPPATLDDELLGQLSREELIARIRSLETKNRKLLYDNGSMMKDINHHLTAIQQLKQSNYQLMKDNTELRDLCCYLDDERSRARAIAREWQSFGTHMSRVMRHEVTSYSSKLSQLETKQFELVRENFELKQLCLLLDNVIATRESGDGSTGSSNNEDCRTSNDGNNNNNSAPNNNNNSSSGNSHNGSANSEVNGCAINNVSYRPTNHPHHHRMVLGPHTLEYVRTLEAKIHQLEWEKKQLCDLHSNSETMDSLENTSVTHSDNTNTRECPANCAEAMRVLRI